MPTTSKASGKAANGKATRGLKATVRSSGKRRTSALAGPVATTRAVHNRVVAKSTPVRHLPAIKKLDPIKKLDYADALSGTSNFARAMRFLAKLTDFERLRIVRYNSSN